jgi:hypothetical protein
MIWEKEVIALRFGLIHGVQPSPTHIIMNQNPSIQSIVASSYIQQKNPMGCHGYSFRRNCDIRPTVRDIKVEIHRYPHRTQARTRLYMC